MKHGSDLITALKKALGTGDGVFPAVVQTVDRENDTCEVVFNEMEFGGIRLQALIKPNSKGVKLYPAADSTVLIQKLGTLGEFFVCMYSEIDELEIKVDSTIVNVKDGVLIQKGNETLKKLLQDILKEIKKITVPTNSGPSGTPMNATAFTAIEDRVSELLK